MCESERQALDRLLASNCLKGPKVRDVLRFLCEKHWADEQVTQYDLAQELYGNVDNLVGARNLIKNLRQKLDLYFATEGREEALHLEIPRGGYEVVFRVVPTPVDKSQAGTLPAAGEKARSDSRRPSASLVALTLVLFLLVIVVVTMQAFSRGWWMAAETLAIEGNQVIGQTTEDPELGRIDLPATVWQAPVLDPNSSNRFAVLYGGLESFDGPPAAVTPHLAILSPKGRILQTIDLLEHFNPFHEQFDPRYFRFGPFLVLDFNDDGHQDILVHCKHIYYPSIVYAYSGNNQKIVGAFANSGFIRELVLVSEGCATSGPRIVGVGINNRMGEQYVAFLVPLFRYFVSPDIETTEFEKNYSYRPLGLAQLAFPSWSIEREGCLTVHGLERSVQFNVKTGLLDTDSSFREGSQVTAEAVDDLVEFYTKVNQAGRLVRSGKIDEGESLYDLALIEAPDEPLRYYVRLDAARSLKQVGLIHEALLWIPEGAGDAILRRRLMLLRGELLTMRGDHELARQTFLDVDNLRYSYRGFVGACILAGMSKEDLKWEIAAHYPIYSSLPSTAAWLRIPALLSGEPPVAVDILQDLPAESGTRDRTEDHLRFAQEAPLWNSVADLELGIQPQTWPDQSNGPMEYSTVFPMKIKLLEALAVQSEKGPVAALPLLKASFRTLEEAAMMDGEAVVPLVLAAYSCGCAADMAGDPNLAREALEVAVARYPHGARYRQAVEILNRPDGA